MLVDSAKEVKMCVQKYS